MQRLLRFCLLITLVVSVSFSFKAFAQNAVLIDDDIVTGSNPAGTTESVITQTGTGTAAALTFGATGATGALTFNKLAGTNNRLVFANATGQLGALSVGTSGQVLVSNGTGAAWTTPSASSMWSLSGNSTATATSFLGTTNTQPIVFKTNNVERMRLNTNGSLALNDPTSTNALVILKSTAWNNWMKFGKSTGTSGWYFHNPQDESAFLVMYSNDAGQAIYPLQIKNNGDIRMEQRLMIGDGTAAMPGNYRLYVTGGILTERIRVATATSAQWADFVFAPDYNLRPLKEVESFIGQNCHLPEVPSAEQVQKEGIDLAEIDAKLLQKVEELTLYVIDLQKQIDQLKQQQPK